IIRQLLDALSSYLRQQVGPPVVRRGGSTALSGSCAHHRSILAVPDRALKRQTSRILETGCGRPNRYGQVARQATGPGRPAVKGRPPLSLVQAWTPSHEDPRRITHACHSRAAVEAHD